MLNRSGKLYQTKWGFVVLIFIIGSCNDVCVSKLGRHQITPVWSDFYILSSFPSPRLLSRPPPPQQLLPLTWKLFRLNLRCLGQRRYRFGEMYWISFRDLDPRLQLWHGLTKIWLCTDIVRNTHLIVTKLGGYIPLIMFITSLDFYRILCKTF